MLFGKEKVVVYIDGGNIYRKLKELGIPKSGKQFDYSAFVNHLIGERELVSKDLVVGAVDNLYDTAIIVSSDTDLIPAIQYVRNGKNKKVEYIGFASNPSLGLIKESKPRLFAESDLIPFQIDKPDS